MGDPRLHAMHNASSASYWIDCSLWFHYKRDAEERGEDYNPESTASRRGTKLHGIAYKVMRDFLKGEGTFKLGIAKHGKKLTPSDASDLLIALSAARDLFTDDMEIELEVAVPLSHEPESTGDVDILGWADTFLLIADYKFGEWAVSPSAYQLKVYASNAIQYLMAAGVNLPSEFAVKQAIIQPRLHREALVRVYTVGELLKFQSYVEGVVSNQVHGHDRRGAGSLKTCEYCDFEKRCFHRPNLVGAMMADLRTGGEIPDRMVEEIVRSRTAFTKVIKDCTELIVKEKKRFPDWTRVDVRNAAKWTSLLSEKQIESKLKRKGGTNLLRLRSPSQVADDNPDLKKAVLGFTEDRTYHVRLYEGAPKGAPRTEPAKRPKAKRPTPKKSAKKKAAKKKGRRTR